jgi:hypothetical protein
MDTDDVDLAPKPGSVSGRAAAEETAHEDRRRREAVPAAQTAAPAEQRRVAKKSPERVDKQSLQRIEQAVAGLADDQARLTSASLERVESAVAALRDERDWQAAVFAQLEEVVTALGEGEKRNQAALTRLARLEDRLDRVVAVLSDSQKRGDAPLVPTGVPDHQLLAELDVRFDELLVALADQIETPTLSNERQVLDEIQARLDEVVGLLADQPGPGSDDEIVAELRRAVAAMEASPVARSTGGQIDESQAILERLDQLVEQVDGLRRRIAVRAKPGAGPGGLDEAILAAIASAVATQLNERPARPRKAAAAPREPRPGRSGPT